MMTIEFISSVMDTVTITLNRHAKAEPTQLKEEFQFLLQPRPDTQGVGYKDEL